MPRRRAPTQRTVNSTKKNTERYYFEKQCKSNNQTAERHKHTQFTRTKEHITLYRHVGQPSVATKSAHPRGLLLEPSGLVHLATLGDGLPHRSAGNLQVLRTVSKLLSSFQPPLAFARGAADAWSAGFRSHASETGSLKVDVIFSLDTHTR